MAGEPVLISMHMEKCGGTSMDRLLRQSYGDGFFLYDPGPPDNFREPEFPEGVRCIHGHLFYGIHQRLAPREARYMTLLRDPRERFLSQFEHLRRYEHPLHDLAMREDGLRQLCADPGARHYRNLFVRRLTGAWDEVGPAHLDRAEEVLRGFALVGRLESLDAFTQAGARLFGWSRQQAGHHNAAPDTGQRFPGLPSAEQEAVSEANRLDLDLMERVQDLLAD